MKLSKKAYAAKIDQASKAQLTVILYDLIIDYMEDASKEFESSLDAYEENIRQAQLGISTLMDALNMNIEISKNLMSLYIYTNKLLVTAFFKKDLNSLNEAVEIMSTLKDGWEIAEKKEAGNLANLENHQQIYAGLTYGRDGLEEYIEREENMGFKA